MHIDFGRQCASRYRAPPTCPLRARITVRSAIRPPNQFSDVCTPSARIGRQMQVLGTYLRWFNFPVILSNLLNVAGP